MTALLLVLLAAAPLGKPGARPPGGDTPALKNFFPPRPARHSEQTACAGCHTAEGWTPVRFNHDKTAFPLAGRHGRAACKACHPVDFRKPVLAACAACHPDAHAGELGARCEGCHDAVAWRVAFTAEAHRNARFPLIGGHAVVPCQECHPDGAERRFAGASVDCAGCHVRDVARTRGGPVDHATLGFTSGCPQCHGATRFTPARFPGHDGCWPISSGPHAGLACLGCHSSLGGAAAGPCNTRTAACTGCHAHECTLSGSQTPTEVLHAKVPGYQCRDRKCYECHQLGGAVQR